MVNKKFRKSPEFIKSFDAIDIVTGRAIGIFDGGKATTLYLMSTTEFDSDTITTIDSRTPSGTVKTLDVDFDTEFQISATVEGTAILNITAGYNTNQGNNKTLYIIARIKKVSGATTTLVSKQSNNFILNIGTEVPNSNRFAIELDIPKTPFKRGDKLRLTIELYITMADEGVIRTGIAHDAANRNDDPANPINQVIEDTDKKELKLQVPFRTTT